MHRYFNIPIPTRYEPSLHVETVIGFSYGRRKQSSRSLQSNNRMICPRNVLLALLSHTTNHVVYPYLQTLDAWDKTILEKIYNYSFQLFSMYSIYQSRLNTI